MSNKKWPSEKLCSSCQWTLLTTIQSQYHSEYRYHMVYIVMNTQCCHIYNTCTIILFYIFLCQKIIINTLIRDWLWYNPSLVIAIGWSESEMSDWCVSGVLVDQVTYMYSIHMYNTKLFFTCNLYTVHKHCYCSVTLTVTVIVQLELLIKKYFYGAGEDRVCSSKSKHNE